MAGVIKAEMGEVPEKGQISKIRRIRPYCCMIWWYSVASS